MISVLTQNKAVQDITMKKRDRLRSPAEQFSNQSGVLLSVTLDEHYPTHIPVEAMLDMVVMASKRSGLNSRQVLKHFQLTDEEITEYFGTLKTCYEM